MTLLCWLARYEYMGEKKKKERKNRKKTDLFTPLLEEQCREGRGELRAEKSGNGGRGGAISSIIVFFIPRPFFFARPPSPPPPLLSLQTCPPWHATPRSLSEKLTQRLGLNSVEKKKEEALHFYNVQAPHRFMTAQYKLKGRVVLRFSLVLFRGAETHSTFFLFLLSRLFFCCCFLRCAHMLSSTGS